MGRTVNKGHCYLCGKYLAKSGIMRHLASAHHAEGSNLQPCIVLKAEAGDYWLYFDVSASATLKSIDRFLRDIWLECCGHLSCFYYSRRSYGWFGGGIEEIGMSRKLSSFSEGEQFLYDYDFGSTTTVRITVMDVDSMRLRQKNAVRLLARNEDYVFPCKDCGKPADYINTEFYDDMGNPFICEACLERKGGKDAGNEEEQPDEDPEYEFDYLLPVVNSPRMGVCAYTGEFDKYTFDQWKAEYTDR